MVALGCGVGVVPELVRKDSPLRGRIEPVDVARPPRGYHVSLCAKSRTLSRRTAAVAVGARPRRARRSQLQFGAMLARPCSSSTGALDIPAPACTSSPGRNGSGKSSLARALAADMAGAELLSAESQQAFYERELRGGREQLPEGVDAGTTVGALLGDRARAERWSRRSAGCALGSRLSAVLDRREPQAALLLRGRCCASLRCWFWMTRSKASTSPRALNWPRAIIAIARALPVMVVGAFRAGRAAVRDSRCASAAWSSAAASCSAARARVARARTSPRSAAHRPPPVELGTFYPALDPDVPLVQLERGRVHYGDHVVFEASTSPCSPGQHTLIEGPNGSGKSTLLELITGDHPQAYSNELHLFGRRRGSGETVWDIKKNVGVVSARLHRDYRVGGSLEDVLISGLFDSIGVYEPRSRAMWRARSHGSSGSTSVFRRALRSASCRSASSGSC